MTQLSKEDADHIASRVTEHIDVRLDEIKHLVEYGRAQNSAEHGAFQYALQSVREGCNKMLAQWERLWRGPIDPPSPPKP